MLATTFSQVCLAKNKKNKKMETNNNNNSEKIEGKIPNQIEEALTHRLRKYANKQCADVMEEFAECSKDKLFSVVYKCRDHQNNLVKCIKTYVNEENKEKLRQAYLRGDLMKKRSYEEYQRELQTRLSSQQESNNV